MTSVSSGPRVVVTMDTRKRASSHLGAGIARLPLAPLIVLVIVLAVAGALAGVSQSAFTRSETRLLKVRVKEAGAVLTAGLIGIQTPLASAVELADATHGNAAKFRRLILPYVGARSTERFASVSLWRLADPGHGPVAVVGARPKLEASPSDVQAVFARAARSPTLSVIGLLARPDRRLGYAFAAARTPGGYAAYAEKAVPSNRQSKIHRESAFAGLNYALYLGSSPEAQDLLIKSVGRLPLRGTHDSVTVPFGDSALTLVMTSVGPLSGSLPQRLPWIIAIGGIVLATVAAAVTKRLIERRRDAEYLATRLETTATENRMLYAEQRSIAESLQRALLPDALPDIAGIETSALYEAGERGMEIGGDWYDLIVLDDRRALLVVGDVSGRGVEAAATMASLRFAIHAYAVQDDPPALILTKLTTVLGVGDGGQLATILCVLVDVEGRTVSVTSAGHLPPLLISGGGAKYVIGEVGLPIGVDPAASYTSRTFSATAGSTLVAFTDGLVERRDESIDRGLSRLRDAALTHHGGLRQLLAELVADLGDKQSADDIAVVGLRWRD